MESAEPRRSRANGLTLRIVSALVLVPLALAAAWLGPPLLPALVALVGAGMGWEWARLSRVASPVAVVLVIAAPFLAACAIAFDQDAAAWLIAMLCAAGAALAERGLHARLWAFAGTLWIALPCVALLWLERRGGPVVIFFLLGVVWASDIGAYACGRLIGGPKLAPKLSPNKTWAGAVGGLLCALLVGFATQSVVGGAMRAWLVTSFIVAIAAELGDLAESFAKRRFGVKDSGKLIPGHGGLLDRLDSLLAASIALALLSGAAFIPARAAVVLSGCSAFGGYVSDQTKGEGGSRVGAGFRKGDTLTVTIDEAPNQQFPTIALLQYASPQGPFRALVPDASTSFTYTVPADTTDFIYLNFGGAWPGLTVAWRCTPAPSGQRSAPGAG